MCQREHPQNGGCPHCIGQDLFEDSFNNTGCSKVFFLHPQCKLYKYALKNQVELCGCRQLPLDAELSRTKRNLHSFTWSGAWHAIRCSEGLIFLDGRLHLFLLIRRHHAHALLRGGDGAAAQGEAGLDARRCLLRKLIFDLLLHGIRTSHRASHLHHLCQRAIGNSSSTLRLAAKFLEPKCQPACFVCRTAL